MNHGYKDYPKRLRSVHRKNMTAIVMYLKEQKEAEEAAAAQQAGMTTE